MMPPADIEREIHHKDYNFKDLVRKGIIYKNITFFIYKENGSDVVFSCPCAQVRRCGLYIFKINENTVISTSIVAVVMFQIMSLHFFFSNLSRFVSLEFINSIYRFNLFQLSKKLCEINL